MIKQKVYHGGWQATNEKQLIRRIQRVMRNIDPEVPRKMMMTLPRRVRLAARRGVESLIH